MRGPVREQQQRTPTSLAGALTRAHGAAYTDPPCRTRCTQRVNPVCSTACRGFIEDVRDSFGCCARFALETSALIIMDRDGTNECVVTLAVAVCARQSTACAHADACRGLMGRA